MTTFAPRLIAAFAFILIVQSLLAQSQTSHPLIIELRDHRPIPPNLLPTLKNADKSSGLAGEILSFTSGKDPQAWYGGLTAMHAVTTNTYTTTASVNRANLWLLIDHPNYLRLYSEQIPEASDPRTTVVVTLPGRGELNIKLDQASLRAEADSEDRWQQALKEYCFASNIEPADRFSYNVNYKHNLQGWKFFVPDLAPGNYKLFATGRWCDATSGPAGYGTHVKFKVHPDKSATFTAPVFDRHNMPEYDRPVEAEVTYRPIDPDASTTATR